MKSDIKNRKAELMQSPRYWLLFWIAVGMAAHSLVVGRLLGSSFFMLAFFWGWIAVTAWRGRLAAAQSMAAAMVAILAITAAGMAIMGSDLSRGIGYYAFALYPALVSWICVLVYIRHLHAKDVRRPPADGRIASRRHPA